MTSSGSSRPRIQVDGKFFRYGDAKFPVKGVAYGPFAPGEDGLPFASPEQTARDFAQMRELGANVVRLYDVPPRWLLDLADQHGLKVWVGIPWNHHLCFLDSAAQQAEARGTARRAANQCAKHPAVFAYSIANEIPPDIVRWSGAPRIEAFLNQLAAEVRFADPGALCTFANYPPTEFLNPRGMDFVSFNVYLHEKQPFQNYLSRLQMLADSKPLVLGEFGIDTVREGEARQAEILEWSVEEAFRSGLAGSVIFSFTDDWYRDGHQIEDWKMGLTTVGREPRPAFNTVRSSFEKAPYFDLPRTPKVSVVVASYNSARTLKACLDSLERLNYPDYEVIVVDDGSTDATPDLIRTGKNQSVEHRKAPPLVSEDEKNPHFPHLRYIRHPRNAGLSVARNTGIEAAHGEIVAFTDADCRADQDWLYYLVGTLLCTGAEAAGGPNFLPPDDSAVAAAVMASPGGPAHVMLNDREAEHIPGCNMAFYKWALDTIGRFDPVFTNAGDDVDVCWRMGEAGFKIAFSPAAFVWHYRRSTVLAYLRQQQGYGLAEALLVRKHPEYFNRFGGSIWRGRIYTSSKLGVLVEPSIIYRGRFGSGWFQTLYAPRPASTLMLSTSIEYHVLVVVPLLVLSATWHWLLPVAIATAMIPLGVCVAAGAQAMLPQDRIRWWSRPLVALLYLLQPIARGYSRYRGRFRLPSRTQAKASWDSVTLRGSAQSLRQAAYWCAEPLDRITLVSEILKRLDDQGWPNKSDLGWSDFDVEVYGSRWSHVQLTTVAESHPGKKRLFRFRLKPRWSLSAHAAFWALSAAILLTVGLGHMWRPWSWLLLLLLPVMATLLHYNQRDLQSKLRAFLDQLARDRGLAAVEARQAPAPPQTATPAEPNLPMFSEEKEPGKSRGSY